MAPQGDGKVLTRVMQVGMQLESARPAGQVYFEAYKTSGQQTIPAGGVHRVILIPLWSILEMHTTEIPFITAPTSGCLLFYGELFWNGQSTNQIEFWYAKQV
ncbi:MAG: hypothetical protein IPJ66_13480 [Bacteroidetes bacterium]|nr:hypothetical protein [Bacteroidota bacterium]